LAKATHRSFVEKLTDTIERNNSLLGVGLDPNPLAYPDHFLEPVDTAALVTWGTRIIEETADLVCCYKPNFAFYEQFGSNGLAALRQTIAAVPDSIPVLLDAKRGDIGSTAAAYARAAFEVWGADAITVSPYLGQDGVTPFLKYPGKMAFVLCYTSNPSARDIQEFGADGDRLFEHIVRQAQSWGNAEQIGFVVGATQPGALTTVRSLMSHDSNWILAPGVGAQGGNLGKALLAGLDDQGGGLIVPVSRGVIYDKAPHSAALAMRGEINQMRQRFHLEQGPTLLHRELIQQLFAVGSIQFGDFTLASGQQSPIYIDLRRIASSALLTRLVALPYTDLLGSLSFDHLAAVPYAALTIGTVVALSTNSSLIYPRKEAKAYGTGRAVEGLFSPGDRAVVIEDLVTTAGSVLKAIKILEEAGLVVADVVVLIDREQGGREALAEQGYRLHAALQMSEILHVLHEADQISADQVASVHRFIKENSV
jgi:uridine monophosphate synthetase